MRHLKVLYVIWFKVFINTTCRKRRKVYIHEQKWSKNTHALKLPNKNQTFDQKRKREIWYRIIWYVFFSHTLWCWEKLGPPGHSWKSCKEINEGKWKCTPWINFLFSLLNLNFNFVLQWISIRLIIFSNKEICFLVVCIWKTHETLQICISKYSKMP